ncbi:protein hunchback [Linepithema humile]|uniref:protein hunchback n=1 Tax=Linepithema humile TaxID=83485 RepID=UPI0006230A84|nr:PREDICTED: protein hunchback [Linepithema humile]
MNELQTDQSITATISNTMKPPDEDFLPLLYCSCGFTSRNKSQFIEHRKLCLSIPTFNKINKWQALINASGSFKRNLTSPTSMEQVENMTEEIYNSDLSIPQVNLHDSPKKQNKGFREGAKNCKMCGFVYRTKSEYWMHMRQHISGFTCTQCEFVTKYKHHMTHHWRSVHEGSKPFECDKCTYSCVSKSMLTSHMKKHSDIYPYNCADCMYKTKFCNALKKHLRKKEHRPAAVLNPDGTPNPSYVIDVYGTKRGPKRNPFFKILSPDKLNNYVDGMQEPSVFDNQDQVNEDIISEPNSPVFKLLMTDETNQNVTKNNQLSPTINSQGVQHPSSVAHNMPAYTVTTTNGMNNANKIDESDTARIESTATFHSPPYSDLMAAFNLPSPLVLHEDATYHENMRKMDTQKMDSARSTVTSMNAEVILPKVITRFGIKRFDAFNNAQAADKILELPVQEPQEFQEPDFRPLDLRIPEVMKRTDQPQLSVTSSPSATRANKRKGRAMKLERRMVEQNDDTDEDSEQNEMCFSDFFAKFVEFLKDGGMYFAGKKEIEELMDKKNSVDGVSICRHCGIIFKNSTMYIVHMGYHDSVNPYTCNMCGYQCDDKVSFFLHISRLKHSCKMRKLTTF